MLKGAYCLSYPCENRGDCIDLFDDYQCICDIGFRGKNCERMLRNKKDLMKN